MLIIMLIIIKITYAKLNVELPWACPDCIFCTKSPSRFRSFNASSISRVSTLLVKISSMACIASAILHAERKENNLNI